MKGYLLGKKELMITFGANFFPGNMPRINRIAAFVSVSFILVFFAKISKVGLYTAYFKTIAEVEIRNSQDLETGSPALLQASSLEFEQKVPAGNSPQLAIHAANGLSAKPKAVPTVAGPSGTSGTIAPRFHFFRQCAPRAPTA